MRLWQPQYSNISLCSLWSCSKWPGGGQRSLLLPALKTFSWKVIYTSTRIAVMAQHWLRKLAICSTFNMTSWSDITIGLHNALWPLEMRPARKPPTRSNRVTETLLSGTWHEKQPEPPRTTVQNAMLIHCVFWPPKGWMVVSFRSRGEVARGRGFAK